MAVRRGICKHRLRWPRACRYRADASFLERPPPSQIDGALAQANCSLRRGACNRDSQARDDGARDVPWNRPCAREKRSLRLTANGAPLRPN